MYNVQQQIKLIHFRFYKVYFTITYINVMNFSNLYYYYFCIDTIIYRTPLKNVINMYKINYKNIYGNCTIIDNTYLQYHILY